MTKKILMATGNKNKAAEIAVMLGDDWQVLTLKDFPELVMPPEDGDTFIANAEIKARYGAAETGLITLADDSGLVVAALNGAPGVYSARYAGEDKSDEDNNDKLLLEMNDVQDGDRQAYFACAIAIALPDGSTETFEGKMDGVILRERRGNGGFGYDPLVYLPELDKTVAELTMDEKNTISHRSRALQKALPALQKLYK